MQTVILKMCNIVHRQRRSPRDIGDKRTRVAATFLVGLFTLVLTLVAFKMPVDSFAAAAENESAQPEKATSSVLTKSKAAPKKGGDKKSPFWHADVPKGVVCTSCKQHSHLGTATYVHTPIAQGICTFCHDTTNFNSPFGLIRTGKNLCLDCHEKSKTFYDMKTIHPPFEKGDCVSCHDPHQSDYPFQLRNGPTPARLCFDCHQENKILGFKNLHGPVKAEDCTACHNPHASNYRKLLREGPDDLALCSRCHKEIPNKIKTSKYKHGVINDGVCSGCHLFHGSNLIKNWKSNFATEFYNAYDEDLFALCFNCHESARAHFKLKFTTLTGFRNGQRNLHNLHVGREKGRYCLACHEPHAGNQEKMIRESTKFGAFNLRIEFKKTPNGGTCLASCHVPKTYDRENPVKLQADSDTRQQKWNMPK